MIKLRSKFKNNKRPIVSLLIAVAVVAGLSYVYLRPDNNKTIIPSTTIKTTAPSTTTPKQGAPSGTATQAPQSSAKQTADVPSSVTVVAPTGPFVSNHTPSKSTDSETSVCNTAPGATCHIEFTKGGITRKLADQITDSTGATYWYWSISGASLDSGSWDVTAVASSGSQSLTSSDSVQLVVP